MSPLLSFGVVGLVCECECGGIVAFAYVRNDSPSQPINTEHMAEHAHLDTIVIPPMRLMHRDRCLSLSACS